MVTYISVLLALVTHTTIKWLASAAIKTYSDYKVDKKTVEILIKEAKKQ